MKYDTTFIEDNSCYTPNDVIKLLGKSKSVVYELFRSDNFPSFKVGERGWCIKKVDFARWQEEQKEKKRGSIANEKYSM